VTRRRFIADEFSSNRAALTGDHADHLIRVLRARVGQEFDIVTGGAVRLGCIASIEDRRVEFDLREELPDISLLDLTLLLAIFKFDRMEWAIEKCTELGVARFVPVISRRTDPHLASASLKRAERWRRIVREASEQSRRPSLPDVTDPVRLKDVLTTTQGTRILLAETENKLSLREAASSHAGEQIALAIGPEGGWTAEELAQFQNGAWISASLGQTVLRAETAAIAATAIVMSEIRR
jgi:16S rRNA (uracil1498-N3)-methyltransferase